MKKILILLTLSLMLISCQKFLDIIPQDKAYKEDLLQNRSGFEMALSGAYTDLNARPLYGKELKFGFMETLVGSYSLMGNSHPYYRSYNHHYTYPEFLQYSNAIWGGLYGIINQANNILEDVDNIIDDPYYKIVKGEALGIRAMCHFQLLKIFGPVIKQEGLNAIAIPYRDAVVFTATKFSTAGEVIAKLNKDLDEARKLMEDDPIRKSSRTADLNQTRHANYNSLLDRRGNRMNYFAIVGFQSLLAQWEGNLQKAAEYAEELIQEFDEHKVITLAQENDINNESTRRLPRENIFALINQDLRLSALTVFPEPSGNTIIATRHLVPNYRWLGDNLYISGLHGSNQDGRFILNHWFSVLSGGAYLVNKYDFRSTANFYSPDLDAALFEVKVISLHNIYMVAAEYYAVTDKEKAISYLNKVRNARGIRNNIVYTSNMSDVLIQNTVFAEVRKEAFGEGYLFTEYKRLFKEIDRPIPVKESLNLFKLPYPVHELTNNPQENL